MLNFAIKQTPRGVAITQLINQPPRLRGLARIALSRACGEYCRGVLTPSILDRFGRSGLSTYGLRSRSIGYVRRQTRDLTMRGAAAFTSPRNVPAARLASALGSLSAAKGGAGTLMAASRLLTAASSRPHLRDLITRPGIGHRILAGGNAKAKVTITYPAARALNANPRYADELRDLSLANYRDWRAITARTRQIFASLLAELQAGKAAA